MQVTIDKMPFDSEFVKAEFAENKFHPEVNVWVRIGVWGKHGSHNSNNWITAVDCKDVEKQVNEILEDGYYDCALCGHPVGKIWRDLKHYPDLAGQARHHMNICFECSFWCEHVYLQSKRPWYQCIVIDGHHYSTSEPNLVAPHQFNGFGGRKFTVRMHSGEQFTTNDLWSQGEINLLFRDLLPDNAEFVNDEKWVDVLGTLALG